MKVSHLHQVMLTPCLDIINSASVNIGVQIFLEVVVSFPSDTYSEVEFLDHMVVLRLCIVFSIAVAPLYNFTCSDKHSGVSRSLPTLIFSVLTAISTGVS